jgi:Holliday junction resolvase
MSEAAIVRGILKLLAERGWLAWKNHGNAFTLAGLPDIQAHKRGRPSVFIEAKRPGEKPKPIQTHRIEQLREAGCVAEVIYSKAEAAELLDRVEAPHVTD